MRNPFARRPPAQVDPGPEAELRTRARALVRPGFTARADVVAALGGGPAAEWVVAEEWRARSAELAAGFGTGDHARLVGAFAALGESGILARMHFGADQASGAAAIAEARTPAPPAGGSRYPFRERAWTFFEEAESEGLGEPDGEVWLSFGSFTAAADSDPADVALGRQGDLEAMQRVMAHTDAGVGREVVTALVDAGLTVTWDGTAGSRIRVLLPDWRKPLPEGP